TSLAVSCSAPPAVRRPFLVVGTLGGCCHSWWLLPLLVSARQRSGPAARPRLRSAVRPHLSRPARRSGYFFSPQAVRLCASAHSRPPAAPLFRTGWSPL